MPILASACLLGINCRYDGGNCFLEEITKLVRYGVVIPMCPEQLAGLPTPRIPCGIVGGSGSDVLKGSARVLAMNGQDHTAKFLKAAEEVMHLVRLYNIRAAILKQRSPSCGFGQIYRADKIVRGNGVIAAQLLQMNLSLYAID